jgi:hypothetical protein
LPVKTLKKCNILEEKEYHIHTVYVTPRTSSGTVYEPFQSWFRDRDVPRNQCVTESESKSANVAKLCHICNVAG